MPIEASIEGRPRATIALVVAADENNVIGRQGHLPWRLPSDLKLFRTLTLGKPIVMGRKTFQSIGKALPGRTNIVVSRDPTFWAPGASTVTSVDAALELARASAADLGATEIMVIGGAEIYRAVMPRARRIYLTRVHATVEGDAKLLALTEGEWQEIERRPLPQTPEDEFACTLIVFQRKPEFQSP